MATGWLFPSDWHCDAVDAVCEAIVTGEGDLRQIAEVLGTARARAGVSLAESLLDVDVLVELIGEGADHPLIRGLSLGWESGCVPSHDGIFDPLTDLPSVEYLSVRLREIYRSPVLEHTLSVIDIDSPGDPISRELTLALVTDVLTEAFAGRYSAARIGRSRVAVLSLSADNSSVQIRHAALLLQARAKAIAPQGSMSAWVEGLPDSYELSVELIETLSR